MYKSKKTIVRGMIFIVILIAVTFFFYNSYMSDQTEKDVRIVGEFLVRGAARDQVKKFNNIIDLRISQVNSVVNKVNKANTDDPNIIYKIIEDSSEFQGLVSCLLLSENNSIELVYGDEIIKFGDKNFIVNQISNNQNCITGGWTNTEQVVIFSMPFRVRMKNGDMSKGILCCRTMAYFANRLDLNNSDGIVYFHLIRNDSSYVVKNADSTGENYYNKLEKYSRPLSITVQDAISQIKASIDSNSDFFMHTMYVNAERDISERRSVYCKRLKNTNWYLVSIVPYKQLDNMISSMSASRGLATLICLGVILLGISIVFIMYLRMVQNQINTLEIARSTAEKAKIEAQKRKVEADEARDQAENAREEAIAANKAKSDFLSNMSHDIRTPMNAIVGMTAIAKEHINDQVRVNDCLKKISLSGKQLLGLINDVLDMSKIESGKMTLTAEAISLRETMEIMCDIVRSQIKSKGLNFKIHIHDIITENIFCDSVRLNQVLLNFLSNAMKFTEEGGAISIELKQEQSEKGNNFVRTHFYVKDTGIGMSSEFKEKLFTSFEREDSLRVHKIQGTGLGMAICKYIVDAMGGKIEVESTQNVGTTFHVILDLEKVNESEEEMTLPDWRILVVDDDPDLCRTAIFTLKELGTHPESCLDGETAIDKVIDAHKKQKDYFAVLIDYKMKGMNGIETAKRIKETVGDVPVSLISAYDWTEIEKDAKEAGITGFIAKPLFKSTLYHELRKYDGQSGYDVIEESNSNDFDISGIRVLLAEDNELNAEIATEILQGQGAVVEHAEDGKKAVEMFNNSAEGYYNFILMDLRMPNMNGYEATKAIRAMTRSDAPTIPIIAMTADAFAEDAKECLAAGMNAHLAKPIDLNALFKTLAKYMS